MAFVFISAEHAAATREKLRAANGLWEQLRQELIRQADEIMPEGPWSVVDFPSRVPSGNPHDYYSEAPYWWPDNGEDQAYIRHDGLVYPKRFDRQLQSFRRMGAVVCMLASAGYYLDERRYLDRVRLLLERWFLDPATKMNPHLKYGEAIPNICEGRFAGIIVLTALTRIVHGLGFLEQAGGYDALLQGMREWTTQLSHWLLTSEIGIGERNNGNNHASWCNTDLAAIAAFTGDDALFDDCLDFYRSTLLPQQILPGGEMPRELERTRSLHYALFNLEALTLLCEAAWQRGVDLWSYRTPEGASIGQAVCYLLPYLENPYSWPYEQIVGDRIDDHVSLQYAALRLGMDECIAVNNRLRDHRYLIREQFPLGPLALLEGFEQQYRRAEYRIR